MKTSRSFLPVIFACILCSLQTTHAQYPAQPVTVTSERNTDNSISIYADSHLFGDYTLKLTFSTLEGYRISGGHSFRDIYLSTINKGKREVFKLTPDKNASHFAYQYRLSYSAGMALGRPPSDTNFLYLLPGTIDKTLLVTTIKNIEEHLGGPKLQPDFFATGFTYQRGDTVCAARGGTIFTSSDETQEGDQQNQVYRSDRNRMQIQQKDGTMAEYVFRAPVRLLVSVEDEVIAGQPLAVFEKESVYYGLMLSVFYLNEKKLLVSEDNISDNGRRLPPFNYLHPKFCNDYSGSLSTPLVAGNRYVVTHPPKVVGAEMSKKERKKHGLD